MKSTHAARSLLLLVVVVLVTFAGSLGGGFVWDDRPLIVQNPLVHGLGALDEVFTSGFWETGDRYDRFRAFFRPIVSLTYALDHRIWGLDPLGFRLTNLALHLICCWLLFRIADTEGIGVHGAMLGATLFAVHPVHVESVAWISGRTDLLCGLFYLGAFLTHRRAAIAESTGTDRRRLLRATSLVLFGLALLSKEMAATLPVILAIDAMIGRRSVGRRLRSGIATAWPYLAVLVLYLVLRGWVLPSETRPVYTLGISSFLGTALFVLARYATLLILPIGLDAHYPYPPVTTLLGPVVLVSAAMLATLIWAGRRLSRWDARAGFWLAWIPLTLAPVMLFGAFGDVLMADRFLYIPSAGLAMILSRASGSLERSVASTAVRRGLLSGTLAILVLLGALSARRATVWRDDMGFFSTMVVTSPRSAMVHCNLGLARYEAGQHHDAIASYRTALELEPRYTMAHNNLAVALEAAGDLRGALDHYRAALSVAPDLPEGLANTGRLLVTLGRHDEGIAILRKLVDERPSYVPALYTYASALYDTGHPDEALHWLERTRDLDPSYPSTHYMIGKILLERGERGSAIASMERFLDLWTKGGLHEHVARRIVTEGLDDQEAPTMR